MKNILTFRTLETKDITHVLKIYNFYIINDLGNFEENPFSYKNFLNLSQNILNSNLPFIICENEKEIIGFAYLNKFRNKSGYKYSFENSIYIENKFIGRGIGSILLKKLIQAASKNTKIKTIIAVIAEKDAESSIKIHEKNGFIIVGTLKKIGFKNNQWLNAIYMQKIMNEYN